jgi:hypothetical protein
MNDLSITYVDNKNYNESVVNVYLFILSKKIICTYFSLRVAVLKEDKTEDSWKDKIISSYFYS